VGNCRTHTQQNDAYGDARAGACQKGQCCSLLRDLITNSPPPHHHHHYKTAIIDGVLRARAWNEFRRVQLKWFEEWVKNPCITIQGNIENWGQEKKKRKTGPLVCLNEAIFAYLFVS